MSQSRLSHSALTDSSTVLSNIRSQSADDRVNMDQNHLSSSAQTTYQTDDKNSSNSLKNVSISPNDWLQFPKMDNIFDIFTICCSTALIIGSLVPYIPQYLKIKRSLNSDGFSTYVCLTLLIANILRIIFWFGHHFELPLLIQSFVVIAGMLILMELCVRVRDKSSSYVSSSGRSNHQRHLINGKRSVRRSSNDQSSVYAVSSSSSSTPIGRLTDVTLSDSCSYQGWRPATRPDAVLATNSASSNDTFNDIEKDPSLRYESLSPSCNIRSQHRYQSLLENNENPGNSYWAIRNMKCALGTRDFWDWDDFNSYLYFLILFTMAVGLLTYLLIENHLYIETVGFVALITESMLGVPQLLRNYKKKSTLGMSVEMVVMWLSGDLYKTLYSVLRHTPPQFIVCGSIQVIVDILILYQVLWFRRPRLNYRKLPTT